MDPQQQLNKDAKLCTRWALGLTFLFVLLFPGVMFLTGYQYTLSFFKGWTYLAFGWLIIAGICIIVGPVVEFVREKKERDTV
ncbi:MULTISPECIES: hypothetical protein [Priestia]|jgi:hypothetical protein|uniref:Uncharacterized protein n=3 Tax=Priestia TaxID=2800373 RepID=A0A1Q8TXU0_PRIMG|nr:MULTISPECIES: hypothetical protein [Priestia]AVX09463.1 hypothetical protein CS527_17685 [Bacillus sp. Y-01]KOP75588.1 hypothetical protein AMS61_14980 [Bacillus sp. FJAT-21351]KQU12781.1 hypothetical protein ASG61_13125 [Bacillus sp. Leaf75]KRD99171.1 hypothetical protein ASE46_12815 [Bacillus sp. Root239]KRF56903.1 hypothetical protein ASG98_07680 [Bacillus sp. Soil531]MBZ5481395.1 hypothetical protein [Bacillus sp. T_4]MCF6797410.1 hypothetical protein [Bacillus sp. ET1]MCJ7985299.1 h